MLLKNLACLLALAAAAFCQETTPDSKVEFEWNYLNFTWPSRSSHENALKDGSYIPANGIITGIKLWKGRLYLTLSRWFNGVPATLTSTSAKSLDGNLSPFLEPFPSWEMQWLDNCSALQFVQSMEIDPLGRMWVLDNGRTEFDTKNPRTKCRPRLVIFDLEDNGRQLMEYVFPEEVARIESVFLNDIVLDHEDGGWAYITDADNKFPGIVVFSLRDRTSWKVTHESMKAKREALLFRVNGTEMEFNVPIDGIALSPASTEGNRTLFYTPLACFDLYSVPVWVLKTRSLPNASSYFRSVGRKSSQTDGMVVVSSGVLHYGLLTENSVCSWDPNQAQNISADTQQLVMRDAVTNQWPDTFAVDEDGWLWWTSNRMQKFRTTGIDLREKNFRVLRAKVAERCYQYYEDGTTPRLPVIEG